MGLLPSSIKLFLRLHKHYNFEGPILTLGNQEVWATESDIKSYIHEAGLKKFHSINPLPHTSNMFKNDPNLAEASKHFIHAKTLFGLLGIDEYFDMDIYDTDSPHYLHDLNTPIDKNMYDKFSLLLDGGTIEHIFDIKKVMENIVNMLKLNGCVVHITSFNIDHGFYAISPCFFYEFYSANGFSDFKCYIIQIDLANIVKNYPNKNICFEYTYGMNFKNLIDSNKMILIFFSARKIEIKPFTIPTQGIFNPNKQYISKPLNIKSNKIFMFRSLIPNKIQPLIKPLYPLMQKLRERENSSNNHKINLI